MNKVEWILGSFVGILFIYSLFFWLLMLTYNVSQPNTQLSVFHDELQKDVRVMYERMSHEVAALFASVDAFQTFNPNQLASPRFLRSPLQAMTSIDQQLFAQQLYR